MDRCQFQRVETVDQVESLKIGTSQGFFSCAAGKKEAGFKGRGRCKHLPICVVGHQKVLGYSTRWIHGLLAHDGTRIYQDNQALGCSRWFTRFQLTCTIWGQFPVRRHQEGLLFEDQPVPGQHPVEASAKTVWIGLASCPIIPRFVGILGACCPWIAAAWPGSRGCTPFHLSSSLLGMWCRCYQPEVQWMNKKGSTQHAIVRMLAGSMRGYFSLFRHHGGILPEFETGSQDEHGTLHNCTVQERPSNNSMPKVLQVFSVDDFSIDDPPCDERKHLVRRLCHKANRQIVATSASFGELWLFGKSWRRSEWERMVSLCHDSWGECVLNLHTYIYIHISLSLYIYLCLYLCLCLYLYLYLYIHTHTHIYISLSLYIYTRHIFALMLLGQPIAPLLSFRSKGGHVGSASKCQAIALVNYIQDGECGA